MIKEYSYTFKKDLLIELCILKFNDDLELKNKINQLLPKIEYLIEKFEDNTFYE